MFPVDADADPHAGIAWFNDLPESERARWLADAGSARPVDAWAAFLREAAYLEASKRVEEWLTTNRQ